MADVVVVSVGERRLAVPTARVREVAAVGNVTPVPSAPPEVVGLTQLRGQIIPVLLAIPPPPAQGEPRGARPNDPLLVVELGPVRAALLVDQVHGVEPEETGLPLIDVGALFDALRGRVANP